MSPQMQQSLAMLQAPLLDLRAMINKELQENPVLEETGADEIATQGEGGQDGQPVSDKENAEAPIEPPADTQVDPTKENNDELVDDFQVQLERLAELSEEWRDKLAVVCNAVVRKEGKLPKQWKIARARFIPERRSAGSCNRSRRSLFSEGRILRSSSSR